MTKVASLSAFSDQPTAPLQNRSSTTAKCSQPRAVLM